MIQKYTCIICGWEKESKDILDFNVHASTEHREVFYTSENSASRNDKRLRDYVNLSRTSDKGGSK